MLPYPCLDIALEPHGAHPEPVIRLGEVRPVDDLPCPLSADAETSRTTGQRRDLAQPAWHPHQPGGIRIESDGFRIDPPVPAEPQLAEAAVPPNGVARLSRCAVRVLLDPVPGQAASGAAHLPGTPGWSCLACAGEWPCPTARLELPLAFAGRRRALGAYLAAGYQRACRDLPDVASRELYRRFLGWLSRDG